MTHSIRLLFSESSLLGATVCVQGWVRSRRDSKAGISFVTVHDGSCFASLQVVVPATLPNYQSEVLKLTKDCAVRVKGQLIASQGEGQSIEMQAESVEVLGWIEDPETYPISPKRHTVEHLRNYAHLRPRTNIIGAVARIRHRLSQAIHEFFNQEEFLWLNTPIITASDCEGAGEMFRVSTLDFLNLPKTPSGNIDFSKDFFGQESFLTVSGQLNAECYALALSKVYTFGPTFRSENSNTSRHLAEFWMVEPEVAFSDLNQNVALADDLLKYVCRAVLNLNLDDLEFFNQWVDNTCIARLQHLVQTPLTTLTYTEAVAYLKNTKISFEFPVEWGIDLQSEHERFLAEQWVKGPVALINYPKDIKAFYMRMNEDRKTVAAMDILVPGIGELMGGSQREERLDKLDQRLLEMKLDPSHYGWYRDLRRYGSVPHSGFGMGFERLISYVTGVANVRDVIPFPRVPGSINF